MGVRRSPGLSVPQGAREAVCLCMEKGEEKRSGADRGR